MPLRNLKEKQLSVPEYMSVLSQEDIEEILELEQIENRIISCGIHPKEESLIVVTADLNTRQILPSTKMRPFYCKPLRYGTGILLMFRGEDKLNFIDSTLLLQASQDCLCDARLFLKDSYMCDVEVISSAPG